jgi:hypothetical protein
LRRVERLRHLRSPAARCARFALAVPHRSGSLHPDDVGDQGDGCDEGEHAEAEEGERVLAAASTWRASRRSASTPPSSSSSTRFGSIAVIWTVPVHSALACSSPTTSQGIITWFTPWAANQELLLARNHA